MYTHTYVRMHTYVHMYTRSDARTHAHTHTHAGGACSWNADVVIARSELCKESDGYTFSKGTLFSAFTENLY